MTRLYIASVKLITPSGSGMIDARDSFSTQNQRSGIAAAIRDSLSGCVFAGISRVPIGAEDWLWLTFDGIMWRERRGYDRGGLSVTAWAPADLAMSIGVEY